MRAGLVVAIFLVTRLLERPITSAQAIGLSALVLFLAAPEQIFSVGTVLTFAAVCGIALFSSPIRARLPERPDWLFSGLAVALAAECATAPVLLWRFNLVAAGAWLTAPLSIPLSGALIALGASLLALYAAGMPPGPLAGALRPRLPRRSSCSRSGPPGCAFLRPTPPLCGDVASSGRCSSSRRSGRAGARAAAAAVAGGALFLALAARAGPRRTARGASRSRRSTSGRETRYCCAGIAGRYSWTGEVRSI